VPSLKDDFLSLRDPNLGYLSVKKYIKSLNRGTALKRWLNLSQENQLTYPSQGLLKTPYDYLDYQGGIQMLPISKIKEILAVRHYFLNLFNHPYRIESLLKETKSKFIPPPPIESNLFKSAIKNGMSLSIADLGASVCGSTNERSSRNERYAQGPFVKFGKYARIPFVGSASPDVWNSSLAIATMACSHALCCIPRNGVLSDINRQADLASEVFEIIDETAELILADRKDRSEIVSHWRANVVGTLEASVEPSLIRANLLFKRGVRTFRVYSPEPGAGPVQTVKSLREKYGYEVEIYTGQITDEAQAIEAQKAGADGIYIGIGGGGRCITGVRSGSLIDWPDLVWSLRGKINIPIIVEGGASDHVAVALLLGVSGIGVTRVVGGGTIESPGGALFFVDSKGKLFKPYGGEASARTKYLDGKMLPFNIPSFVEGETTKAYVNYVKYSKPTLTYNLHVLLEDAILALVFRNSKSISEMQSISPSPIKQATSMDILQRGTH
jgi:IMP dehydrogenase / GMP reductase domain